MRSIIFPSIFKSKKRVAWWAELLVTLLCSYPAFAESSLEKREIQAASEISDANLLSNVSGRFVQARDHYYLGSRGVKTVTEEWLKEAKSWTDSWFELLALLNSSERILSLSTVEAKVAETIQKQGEKLESLIAKSHAIEGRTQEGINLLSRSLTLRDGMLTEHKSVLEALKQSRSDLVQAIKKMGEIPRTRLVQMAKLVDPSRDAILAKLKAKLIELGRQDLVASLRGVQDLLQADEVLSPILLKATRLEQEINADFIFLRIFSAEKTHKSAQTFCTEAAQQIESMRGEIVEVHRNTAAVRVTTLCGNINDYMNEMRQFGQTKNQFVASYSAQMANFFRQSCSQGNVTASCERAAVLAAIPRHEFQNMPPSRLEFVEKSWKDIQTSQGSNNN
jgi:hypothetical protein